MSSWFFSSPKSLQTPQQQPTQRSHAQSLLHYETGSPPPSARVDPKLKLRPRRPLRLWDYWKFGAIVAVKATELTSDVLSHHIYGPRRKSWGIEMTIVTSLIRGAERHSALVDIGTIRMLMSIGGLVPLPSDALVTPVTFRVRKRNLRGILAEFDASETGTRELSGEWVVGRKTWQRMQTDWKAANMSDPALSQFYGTSPPGSSPGDGNSTSTKASPKRKELVVLYIHGGAYYLSSAAAQRILSIPLAKYTDSRVFALDYRLAPETCFPGPLHDAVSAYLRLVEDLHIPPENIIICGDSAGGGLSLALLMYLRDNGYSLPSGAILLSPWVDLTMSCESWDSNAPYDVVPFPSPENHMNPIALYLGEHTERYLTHPYASPLFGDFKGLPPLLIQAGDAEVLRDEITLLAHKATLAGVQVMHELYEDAIHVFQAYPFLEASRLSFESMRNFVRFILPQHRSRSPQLLASIAERGLEREIENDRAVVVGGDGVEVPAAFNKQEFRKEDYPSLDSKEMGSANDGNEVSADEDSDVGPSWVRSPAWPTLVREDGMEWDTQLKEMAIVEHIENVTLQDIPDLQLPPPSSAPGPIPRRASSIPSPPRRPGIPSFSSSSSILSASSSKRFTLSPDPPSPPPSPSPRKIRSSSSLAAKFALQFRHSQPDPFPNKNSASPGPHSQCESSRRSPSQNFPLNLAAAPMSSSKHIRSRSTTFLAAPQSLAMSSIQQTSLASPSIRKRRKSSGFNKTLRLHGDAKRATTDPKPKSLASADADNYSTMDVKALVDDWTRLGPANETVMVTATPLHPGR